MSGRGGERPRPGSTRVGRGQPLYQPMGWGLVRAPALPVNTWVGLSRSGDAGPHAGTAGGYASLDPIVEAALTVATTDLTNALTRPAASERDARRLRSRLARYLIRMSSRPTPYGLFAGTGLIHWSRVTDIALGAGPPRTRTRPDMEWLIGLVMRLEGRAEVRRQLRLVANPAAWISAGRVFLAERGPRVFDEEEPLSISVRATGPVRRALALTRAPMLYADLASELLTMPGARREKVERLIDELWEQTLLITDLRPPLTGHRPIEYVAERLEGIPGASEVAANLRTLTEAIRAWDDSPIADRASRCWSLRAQMTAIHALPSTTPPLQVDSALRLDGHLVNEAVATEAARAAELLLRLSPIPPAHSSLDGYRRSFTSRYGLEREVPLLELLDPDFGLGPPGGDGLPRGGSGDGGEQSRLRQETLRDLALSALRDRRLVVELDAETIARLETWSPDPTTAPTSLDISVFVIASSRQTIDSGDFLVVVGPNLGAAAAGRTLGRFADLWCGEAQVMLRQLARAEEHRRRHRLLAEIVYLPRESRTANVAIRPVVRDYEIVLGTSAGVPPDRVIPLDELVIGVREGRFYARWPAAGAEVVGCSGHMLHSWHAPAVLRFLEDVSADGLVQPSTFDWGPAAAFPFLPRVQSGRVVLQPARWQINRTMRDTELPREQRRGFGESLAAWRHRWAVPRRVYLSTADNRLLIDLECADQADQVRLELERLREGSLVVLEEALPGPEHAWAAGVNGRYLTELVVPVVLREAPNELDLAADLAPVAAASVPPGARLRPPGSEWLFLKLYCPPILEEDLIAGPIHSFCDAAVAAGSVEDWFFVRYHDPDPHLRLRLRGDSGKLALLLPEACSWAAELMSDGRCLRFALDTYDREIERYGGPDGIEVAEQVFAADSRAVVELLRYVGRRPLTVDRTTVAVLSFDDLLDGLGLDVVHRLAWYRQEAEMKPHDARAYRERQASLRTLLSRIPPTTRDSGWDVRSRGGIRLSDAQQRLLRPGDDLLARIFADRRARLATAAERLHDLGDRGRLTRPVDQLYRSYLHMHHNRLVGRGQPAEELVLSLLRRTRESLHRAPVGTGGSRTRSSSSPR